MPRHGSALRPAAWSGAWAPGWDRKAAFVPTLIECFWIPDTSTLDAAIDAGAIKHQAQGRQAPVGGATTGRERRPKYSMNLAVARKRLLVPSHSV